MEITYQISTNIRYNHVIEKTESFTFPPIRKKVLTMPIAEPYTGVWAVRDKKIIAMILADNKSADSSELFSFFVIPDERNKGIATQLLALLENSLKEQNKKFLFTRYRNDWSSKEYIEKLLNNNQWKTPELLRIIASGEINNYPKVKWPVLKLASENCLLPWSEITSEDKKTIDQWIAEKKIPPEFDPRQHGNKIDAEISTAMRKGNKLIGWNIVYRLKEDTLEYNNLFIEESYRQHGLAFHLLKNSCEKQYHSTIPNATWVVNADNMAVLKFTRRVLEGMFQKLVEVKISNKVL